MPTNFDDANISNTGMEPAGFAGVANTQVDVEGFTNRHGKLFAGNLNLVIQAMNVAAVRDGIALG